LTEEQKMEVCLKEDPLASPVLHVEVLLWPALRPEVGKLKVVVQLPGSLRRRHWERQRPAEARLEEAKRLSIGTPLRQMLQPLAEG
jgi:hypothetical protein